MLNYKLANQLTCETNKSCTFYAKYLDVCWKLIKYKYTMFKGGNFFGNVFCFKMNMRWNYLNNSIWKILLLTMFVI